MARRYSFASLIAAARSTLSRSTPYKLMVAQNPLNILQAADGRCLAGIGASDITKLKANGYYTVAVRLATDSLLTGFSDLSKAVHAATRRTLAKIKGFSEVKVEKVR